MTQFRTKVAIVGGGMCGISCALSLEQKQLRDFLVVSPTIGGRVKASDDGMTNYGAYYVRGDCRNVLQLVKRTRAIKLSDIIVSVGPKPRTLTSMFWRCPFSSLRLLFHIARFNYHYQRLKKQVPTTCQKEGIEKNSYLYGLYQQNCLAWLKHHRLMRLEEYIRPIVAATAMADLERVHAAAMLDCFLIALYPTYEFLLSWEQTTAHIAEKLVQDEVTTVTHDGTSWRLETAGNKTICADFLVMAVPLSVAAKLVGAPIDSKCLIHCFMWHIDGKRRKNFEHANIHVFDQTSHEIVIAHQENKTSLLFSRSTDINLDDYFENPKVLAHQKWDQAFYLDPNLIPARFAPNMVLLGDHNIAGMEDCFLFGQFGANVAAEELAAREADRLRGISHLNPIVPAHGNDVPILGKATAGRQSVG